jgi:2-C-methyl-D-erythritol 4-phosphate cytidylyltransferase
MPKYADIAHGVADVMRAANGKKKYKPTSAVIVAAGGSTRMGGIDKQFMPVCGMPVLAHTVKSFEDCPAIGEIIIVTRPESVEKITELCREHGFLKVKEVVIGGADRQESVWNGFSKIDDRSEFVAIHDGARCLITPEQIEKIVLEAYRCGAATAATRATDTVKIAEKGAYISDTCDRNKVWLAQTPQVFDADLYRAATYLAGEANFKATDDCMLAEHMKFNQVKLVECGKYNMKITTPDDVIIAEAILASRKKN